MKFLWIFIFVTGFQFGRGEKILGIVSMPSKSHYHLFERLFIDLTKKGHEVTLITPFKQSQPVPKLKEIFIPNLYENFIRIMTMNTSDTSQVFKVGKWMRWAQLLFFAYMGPRFMDYLLSRSEMQQFLKADEKFDLIVGETVFVESAVAGFSYKYNAPIVSIAPFLPNNWANHMVGNPAPASYIPDPFLGFNNKMTFWEKVQNTLYGLMSDFLYDLYYIRKHDEILKKYFGQQTPFVGNIIKNTSLVLVNHHFSLAFPRPYLPNMVEIGGYHICPPKPLPADLQKYFNESEKGVILFSLGSHIKSSELPEDKKKAILRAFSRLNQNVLWKFEDDTLTDLPKNVKISKWLPQSDVLAHPNLKLFITHGGLLSTTEAATRGVPIIGIPLAGDQHINMNYNTALGFGLTLELNDLSEETLHAAIIEVLNNYKYNEKAKLIQGLIEDRPLPALDTALYWIEYVMRYKGAPHLRSAGQDLAWYQLYLLDVLAFIFIVSSLLIYISFKIVKFIVKRFCCRSRAQVSKKKKNK